MSAFTDRIKDKFIDIQPRDVVDILVIAVFFFFVYKFIRRRRALPVLIGVIAYVVIMQLCKAAQLYAAYRLLDWLSIPVAVSILIIFQADIRAGLEKIGTSLMGLGRMLKNKFVPLPGSAEAEAVEKAVMRLSATKTGALIVLEKNTGIEDIGQDGVKIDAAISSELICNLFFAPAPLHDGAIIIRKKRISAAGCFLPNYSDPALNSSFGSRHRAAIGMSRNSDAGVIVVSEEDGKISYAYGGELSRGIDEQTLVGILEEYYGVSRKNRD